jgi:hypothetical protein
MSSNHSRDLLDDMNRLAARVRDLEASRAVGGPQLLYRTVLDSSTSVVRIPKSGSIPQNSTNLRLLISARSSGASVGGYDPAGIQFNGATSGYNWNSFSATQGGSSMSVANGSSAGNAQCAQIWNSFFGGTGGRGIAAIDIPNYADVNNLKSFTSSSTATDGGSAGVRAEFGGSLSGTTAAITSITVVMGIGSFLADSTFCLYGS